MACRLRPQPGPCCPWGAEVKHNSISGSRKPYGSALATCSASLRDGLRLASHHRLSLTLWGGMQNSTRLLLWSYLGSLYQRVFGFAHSSAWIRNRKEGLVLSLPTCVSSSRRKCWAGWEICSVITGALDRQNRIILILGFCFFSCASATGNIETACQNCRTSMPVSQDTDCFLVPVISIELTN